MTTQTDAYERVNELARWSPWLPFADSAAVSTTMPGVYLMRLPKSKQIVYVGMAGERNGQGIRGRMAIYRSGKGAASGFGEAAFDRALADGDFVVGQLTRLHGGENVRLKQWAKDAIAFFAPEICWAETEDRASALVLEKKVEGILRPHGIWNR